MPKIKEFFEHLDRAMEPLKVIAHPSDDALQWIISNYLPRLPPDEYVKRVIAYDDYLHGNLPEEMKRQRYYYADIIPQLIVSLGLQDDFRSRLARKIMRDWYKSGILTSKLGDPSFLFSILAQRKELEQYVGTKESLVYINFLSVRLLNFLYFYGYASFKRHRDCNGKIKYGYVKDAPTNQMVWSWYCEKCLRTIPDDKLDEMTVTVL